MTAYAKDLPLSIRRVSTRPFDILLVLVVLSTVALLLRVREFGALHRMVSAWPTIGNASGDRREIMVARVGAALAFVSNLCLGRNRCLYRSATAVCVLRFKGVPAHLVIGVRALPFASHAWVEVDRRVVLEPAPWNQTYKEIERF